MSVELSREEGYAGLRRVELLASDEDYFWFQVVEGCGYAITEMTATEARAVAQELNEMADKLESRKRLSGIRDWTERNRRRVKLAKKKNHEGLTAEERQEFDLLQHSFFEYLETKRSAPLVHSRDLDQIEARLRGDAARTSGHFAAINIIFDGPPSHESGRFVEVENDAGASIRVGEWIDRGDGTWALRIRETTKQCTCHERDSSVTCPACHAEGYFGHMEQRLQEEWDAKHKE